MNEDKLNQLAYHCDMCSSIIMTAIHKYMIDNLVEPDDRQNGCLFTK
jgi:hypothetical protein